MLKSKNCVVLFNLLLIIGVSFAGVPRYQQHSSQLEGGAGGDYSSLYDEGTLSKYFSSQEEYTTPYVQKFEQPVLQKIIAEPTTPPHYEYGYSVKDPQTGDVKTQHEVRKGDAVHGSYSVVDADGTKRTVEYTADAEHGFQAVIHKEPAAIKAPTIKYAQPQAKFSASEVGLSKYASYAQSSPNSASYYH